MPADEAIVLAGGFGTRLRGIVDDVPKPLAPVAGRPFLAWLLDRLAMSGMHRCILATGYMADTIERAIGTRWQGMDIAYSVEPEPLGTGGAIRLAAQRLQGDGAHVLNGDTWLEYAPAALEAAARAASTPMAIALARVDDVARYGAVDVRDGLARDFREKGEAGVGERAEHVADGEDAAGGEAVGKAGNGEGERAEDEAELGGVGQRADVGGAGAPLPHQVIGGAVGGEPQRGAEQLGDDDDGDWQVAHHRP